MDIFDVADRYKAENHPLIILAGAEYGSGSSRDWAAKGPYLLGVKYIFILFYFIDLLLLFFSIFNFFSLPFFFFLDVLLQLATNVFIEVI